MKVSDELVDITVSVVDGWYPEGSVDWGDVWDRVDGSELNDGSRVDLGNDLTSLTLVELKQRVQAARRT